MQEKKRQKTPFRLPSGGIKPYLQEHVSAGLSQHGSEKGIRDHDCGRLPEAEEPLRQIEEKGYARAYAADRRTLYKIRCKLLVENRHGGRLDNRLNTRILFALSQTGNALPTFGTTMPDDSASEISVPPFPAILYPDFICFIRIKDLPLPQREPQLAGG